MLSCQPHTCEYDKVALVYLPKSKKARGMPADAYIALALQTTCFAIHAAPNQASARARMMQTLRRISGQIAAAKNFIGPDLKLVVLPEYVLTGFPMGESAGAWAEKAGIDQGGEEYAALGGIARDNAVHIAGNAYERDTHFPGLYFQTCFLVSAAGDVVLRYRRLISLFGPSPYDVYDRYVEIYGAEALFPVADTAIGRIAAVASEEILYPEIARAMALRGAEILVHSSSETGSRLTTPKNIAKQARAIENLAYLVSANTAGIEGTAIPAASTDGQSQVVDFRGQVLALAAYGESMAASAEIDLAALRRYRRRPGMGNLLSRQPVALWREAYAGAQVQPQNGLLNQAGQPIAPDTRWYAARQQKIIDLLSSQGII